MRTETVAFITRDLHTVSISTYLQSQTFAADKDPTISAEMQAISRHTNTQMSPKKLHIHNNGGPCNLQMFPGSLP